MRIALTLTLFLALPAKAWTFDPVPLCTLSQLAPDLQATVTSDPGSGLYALSLLRPEGWPEAAVFSIRFGSGLTISTNRHVIEGTTLSVTDTGFGNVLSGMEAGGIATALLGALELPIDMTGAPPAVAEFRACPATPTA